MKKKIIILIVVIISLTGCSSEYNIEFKNGKIKEQIVTNILSEDIPSNESTIAEVDDRVTPFINDDQYPMIDSEEKYSKKIKNNNDGSTTVTLEYTYSHGEYRKSNVYRTCFDKSTFKEYDSNYLLSFNGKFYCLYGDELVVNIKTNNRVLSNNADKVDGNTYTWVINKDNVDNVNISIKISKQSKLITYVAYIIVGIASIGVIIFASIVYKKIKNRDSVNEI